MSNNPDQWVGIQFAVDADTPADLVQWAGKVVLVDPDRLGDIGSGPANPGTILGLRGYRTSGGPTGNQWVLTGTITNAIRDQIGQIPGGLGWQAPASRATYRTAAALLIRQYKVPAPDVIALLTDLYNAATANATTAPSGG